MNLPSGLQFMRIKCWFTLCLVLSLLAGCGKNVERQVAREKFRDALAAIKVYAEKGSTYAEFRERRLHLETCYEGNKQYLTDLAQEAQRLSELLQSSDFCWKWEIKSSEVIIDPRMPEALHAMRAIDPEIAKAIQDYFHAMAIYSNHRNEFNLGDRPVKDLAGNSVASVDPSVFANSRQAVEEGEKNPEFYARRFVRKSLSLIREQCDAMLGKLR